MRYIINGNWNWALIAYMKNKKQSYVTKSIEFLIEVLKETTTCWTFGNNKCDLTDIINKLIIVMILIILFIFDSQSTDSKQKTTSYQIITLVSVRPGCHFTDVLRAPFSVQIIPV